MSRVTAWDKEQISRRNLILNMKIEAALLVVKGQIYNKVILIFEMRNHVIIKVNQQPSASFLEYFFDHVRGNIVLLRNLWG